MDVAGVAARLRACLEEGSPATGVASDCASSGYGARVERAHAALEGFDGERCWDVVAQLYGEGSSAEQPSCARAHAEWLDAGKNAVSPERQRLLLQVLVAVTTRPSRHIDTDADQPSSSGRLGADQWCWLKQKLLPVAERCSRRRAKMLSFQLLDHMWRDAEDVHLRNQSALEFLEVTLSTAQSTALTIKEEDWGVLASLACKVLNCYNLAEEALADDLRCRLARSFLPALFHSAEMTQAVSMLLLKIYNSSDGMIDVQSILSDVCGGLDADGGVLMSASSHQVSNLLHGMEYICDEGVFFEDGAKASSRGKIERQLQFSARIRTEQHVHDCEKMKCEVCCGIGYTCMDTLHAWLSRLIAKHTVSQCEDLFGESFPSASFGWQSGFQDACRAVLRFALSYDTTYGATRMAEWFCNALACKAADHDSHLLAIVIILHCVVSQDDDVDTSAAILRAMCTFFNLFLSIAEATALAGPSSCQRAHHMWASFIEKLLRSTIPRVKWSKIHLHEQESTTIDGVRLLLYCAHLPKDSEVVGHKILRILRNSQRSSSAAVDENATDVKRIVVGESVSFWSPRLRKCFSAPKDDGRKSSFMHTDPIGAAEYKEKPSVVQKVEWCILCLCRPHCDTENLGRVLPLIFPMIDDYEEVWQMRGLVLLRHVLSETVPTAFRFHSGLIYTVLQHALSSRHCNVSSFVLQCLEQCVRMSERRGQEETNPRLHEILSCIADAIAHAQDPRRSCLLKGIAPLIQLTGIQFVRHLPQVFPWLLRMLSEGSLPFAHEEQEVDEKADDDSKLLSFLEEGTISISPVYRVLMTIITACWPRMNHHRAKIMACVCRSVMISKAAICDAARTLALLCIVSNWCSANRKQDKAGCDSGTFRDAEVIPCEAWMEKRFTYLLNSIKKSPTGDILHHRLHQVHKLAKMILSQRNQAAAIFGGESETIKSQGWFSMQMDNM